MRLAVDIVLLAEKRITEKAIELNRQLIAHFGTEIVLGRKTSLPHISLAMGCMEESDLREVSKVLGDIAGSTVLGELEITGITVSTNAKGQKVSVMEIALSEQLRKLHEAVMDRMAAFFKGKANGESIAEERDVSESTLDWINNYRRESSYEKFQPHITIGYGEQAGMSFTGRFAAERLALCHLGNHCTCARLLWDTAI